MSNPIKILLVIAGIVLVSLNLYLFAGSKKIRLLLESEPGVAVKGFFEVDGVRKEVTELPFQYEGKVHRFLFQIEPVGKDYKGLSVQVFDEKRCFASTATDREKHAIRGWMRNDLWNSHSWIESYNPTRKDEPWFMAPQ